MQRRSFVTSCVSGAIAGALHPALVGSARLEAAQPSAASRALSALRSARQLAARGEIDRLRNSFHSDALLLNPGLLTAVAGRAMIADSLRQRTQDRRPLYFYHRQPQVVVVGNAAIVASNYEAGYTIDGRTVEDSGKSTSVVLLGPNPPLIAMEVDVPNIYAGSYGARGTALARPRFGIFPLRALGQPPITAATTAGGGENDVLFNLVKRINRAWVAGNAAEIMRTANRSGVFLVGDYSPFYLSGTEQIREHFDDFYQTSRVHSIQELSPSVKIWGDVAAVAFTFDLDYEINNQRRRAPGRAVYTFVRRGAAGLPWGMAACSATHLVTRDIGDPYPLPTG